MKAETILFLLSIHEGNELRDQLPTSAYDELSNAGLLDQERIDITDRGYAFVRQLEAVELPVQMWVDPRSLRPTLSNAHGARSIAALDTVEPASAVMQIDAPFKGPVKIMVPDDAVPAGYSANPGHIPPGVDRASDISIVRANGKRKTLPAQAINWADKTTPDRVIGWRYAAAGAEGRIHTPGETMPAPDPSVQ